MNIWLVTIGSSDVQLDSDKQSRKKGRKEERRSNKIWNYWYEDEVQAECYDLEFEPKQPYRDKNEPYRIEPRVLGMVYESSSTKIQDEIWSYLTFPLLDNFVAELQKSPPEAIVVLLTDQAEIFSSDYKREKQKCPYWQDTCTLRPILDRYFAPKNIFPEKETQGIELEYISLAPTSSQKGLDNWDYVLDLVDEKLGNLQINGEAVKKESVKTAYVSHQAGTPAISSAVQFASLAKFEKVEFLVSNEYDSSLTELVPDSKYLQKLQREKAKQLLARHDYSGVKEVFSSHLDPDTQKLLEAAIKWNHAEFNKFIDELTSCSNPILKKKAQERKEEENWWWSAYESAYLGVVRLKQEDTVEAIFHSFRAVEGLLAKWVDEYDKSKERDKKITKQGKKIKLSHKIIAPWDEKKEKKTDRVNAYGKGLYFALDFVKGVDKNKDTDIWTFGKFIFDKRNNLFHKLRGLQDRKAVFEFWEIDSHDEQEWKDRVLGCLNFVAKPKPCPTSLEEASLMFKVHQELEKAIAE